MGRPSLLHAAAPSGAARLARERGHYTSPPPCMIACLDRRAQECRICLSRPPVQKRVGTLVASLHSCDPCGQLSANAQAMHCRAPFRRLVLHNSPLCVACTL